MNGSFCVPKIRSIWIFSMANLELHILSRAMDLLLVPIEDFQRQLLTLSCCSMMPCLRCPRSWDYRRSLLQQGLNWNVHSVTVDKHGQASAQLVSFKNLVSAVSGEMGSCALCEAGVCLQGESLLDASGKTAAVLAEEWATVRESMLGSKVYLQPDGHNSVWSSAAESTLFKQQTCRPWVAAGFENFTGRCSLPCRSVRTS